MIHSVVDFHSLTAKEVMIPRGGVQTVRANATIKELLALSLPKTLDRLPVTNRFSVRQPHLVLVGPIELDHQILEHDTIPLSGRMK